MYYSIRPIYNGSEFLEERAKVRDSQIREVIREKKYIDIMKRVFDRGNINNLKRILEYELFFEHISDGYVDRLGRAIKEDRIDIIEFTEEYIDLADWGFVGLINELAI